MKKFIVSLFVVLLITATYGCTINVKKASETLSSYTANLVYDNQSHTVSGDMTVNFINKTNSGLKELRFNLYPNAFREDSKQDVISLAKSKECYYNGESFGGIEISSVKNNNKVLNYEIAGTDENVLKVQLENVVEPTQSTSLTMDFEVTLPNISHRFGYAENTINLGNFLPILCVYENGQWQEIEYSANGDPFFSEVANYFVTISYDNALCLASSGQCTQTEVNGETATKHITALAVRDFAMVLSEKFELQSQEVDGVKVNYYFFDDPNFQSSLDTATKAVKTFNNLFGQYPYKELDVVQADFCIGGMEFPNLVLIDGGIEDYNAFQMVIVHEIAHQWWYGVVGNNQTSYPWVDEALAEFSTALFYEKNAGYELTYETIMDSANTTLQVYVSVCTNVNGKANLAMNRSLDDYETENEYIYTTYTQGMLMFDALSKLLSEKVVLKCLKNYYETYALQVVTPAHLIASFERTTSCNLEPFFNSWIEGKVVFGA